MGIDPAWRARLNRGLKTLELSLPDEVCEQLLRFIALLLKWNRAYNLTAIRDPLEMVERHLIDSLSILPHLSCQRILDMGTGPGLPGIPLALALPESDFMLLDSNQKKIRFVRQAVLELGLKNVQPVHARVEDYQPEAPIDCLVSRAFTSLPSMLALSRPICSPETRILAMKGTIPQQEIEKISATYRVETHSLKAPIRLGERHLIVMVRSVREISKAQD